MMNLVYVFQEYPVFYQPYIPPIVNALMDRKDINFKVNVFKGNKQDYIVKIPPYHFRRIYEAFYHLIKNSPRKLNYLEIQSLKQHVDILHLQDSFLHPKIIGLLEIEAYKRPKIIITLRGADTYLKPYVLERWKLFYKNYGNKVDAFITVSKHQKKYLTKWGVSAEKIHVIPISFGSKSNESPRKLSRNKIRIISAFRMTWEKNIDSNIRVVKNLIDNGYDVTYDIYGDGADLGQVFYLIDRYNLNDSVKCHGKIPNEEFKSILPKYDFYLQLSISESAGATIIEAQSYGLPCIVSDSDGLPEMIIQNETGFAVPYYEIELAAQKIIELYTNEKKYNLFSKASIQFVNSKFTVENEEKLLVNLYKQLLN
ncbi:glycosyltransferase family 4 protein [Paucihalobacter ruber]|uniref:Glycosyltransferase family 4 protein n=1 Tax=Paucihalobacter ruber TaxID=2567861 RepID=A0A506PNW6_9FLAO|nr:glycosyltransferase family 4 protein [Paucihalobacter ruber]TPV33850.1 glycosyltransferase family 4 protein [Paucihalobacter ruber]